MRRVAVLFLGLAGSSSVWATEIEHRAVGCVVAGQFPRLEARLTPADTVGRARVVFRPETGRHWYSVAMSSTGDAFAGVLPKPLESLKKFVYYIEVTDRALATVRTAEYTPAVVAGLGACRDKAVASAVSSAAVALEAPVGAPLIPAGFASSGVASVAGAAPAGAAGSGSGAGGATVAAGMGAGMKAALILGVGAAAAAGVAVAAGGGSSGDGDGDGDEAGGGPGPPVPSPSPSAGAPVYDVFFLPSPPGIDVSACAGGGPTWCCQNVTADANGSFNTTWAPSQPNVLRVTGSVSATAFNATLACVSGPGSGSIQASGSGGTYQGSWSFAGQNGSVTVRRITQ